MASLLLVRAGRAVRRDEFFTLLWGDDPPARAADIVHRHIGSLRRALEPDLAARREGRWLQRRDGGYALRVADDELDLLHFQKLSEQARRAADRPTAIRLYLEALRLWDDRCAAGLHPSVRFEPEFAAIDRRRSVVASAAADMCLTTGQVTDMVAELSRVAALSPFDEGLQARLLLVLAAAGRQGEAVELYRALRARLADELGVDPGVALRSAYDRLLHQEVVVSEAAAPEPPAVRAPFVVPAQLPPSSRYFHGREAELHTLDELVPRAGQRGDGAVTVALDGVPGVGKSSLVVHWAHGARTNFPDGQLYLDLRGDDRNENVVEPGHALARMLEALGVPHQEIPAGLEAKSSMYRSRMAGRRILVILDNARDVDQVRPLIPATPGCLTVTTSRTRMAGLIARDGAHPLTLDVLSVEEARATLRQQIGDQRIGDDGDALDDILRRCGRLPLALAVVGARARFRPAGSLRDIAEELASSGALDA